MTRQHFDVLPDLTELTHQVEDQSDSQNCHQFNCPKMTYLQEGSLGEGSPGEDSLAEEYLVEEEGIWVEESHQAEDLLEEDGNLHQFKYLNHNPEN